MTTALHICQRDDWATGGAARVAVELVKRLPDYGVRALCVFVYGEPGPFGEELGEQAVFLGLSSSRQALLNGEKLRTLLAREQPSIVHHHDGLIWTHLITKQWPSITRFGHGHLSPREGSSHWRAQIATWIQKRTYDHLICVSTEVQRDWVNSGFSKGNTTVISNGVDIKRFRPPTKVEREALRAVWGLQSGSKVVGFVGRLHSGMKGCDDFIRMVAELPSNYVGVLAGAGPDRIKLEALATRAGIGNRIHFLGNVDPATEAFWGFDVFTMTSRIEPFGLVVLEAAATGLPVVVFPARGGVMELAEKLECMVLDSRDPGMAAKRILEVTKSLDSLKLSARRSAVETLFSWEAAVAKVAFCYREVLN